MTPILDSVRRAKKDGATAVIMTPETHGQLVAEMKETSPIQVVNRRARRAAGFRGPAFEGGAPSLVRFVRKHHTVLTDMVAAGSATRRQRKARARIHRAIDRRGGL